MKVILNASTQPYFSIACRYGGATINGMEYVYMLPLNALIRKDVMAEYKKHVKKKGSWESFLKKIEEEK